MPFVSFADIIAELDNVDAPDVLERAKTSTALNFALEMSRPRNWWGTGVDPNTLFRIAKDDGIPLAWVPRSKIIVDLSNQPNLEARRKVLQDHREDILDDCETALAECDDPWLGDHRPLASAAIEAYKDGHHEASMALAVSIGEPLAIWASTPRVRGFDSKADMVAWEKNRKKMSKYRWAETELATVGVDLSRYHFKHQVLIAPIPRFFTPWRPEDGTPAPRSLSRHVVAHQPSVSHFSDENALLGLMLVTSLLREQQSWSEEVRATDAEPYE